MRKRFSVFTNAIPVERSYERCRQQRLRWLSQDIWHHTEPSHQWILTLQQETEAPRKCPSNTENIWRQERLCGSIETPKEEARNRRNSDSEEVVRHKSGEANLDRCEQMWRISGRVSLHTGSRVRRVSLGVLRTSHLLFVDPYICAPSTCPQHVNMSPVA